MEIIIGLITLYFWIHSVVIIIKETKVSGYKKVVLIVGFSLWALFLIGYLSE